MKRINVPDYNTYADFPDDMPDAKVQEILQRDFPPKTDIMGKVENFFNNIVEGFKTPIKTTLDVYGKERQAALQTVKESVTKPSWTSPFRAGLGALQYLYSPIEAATEGFVGKPLTDISQQAGASPEVARGIGNFGKYATQMLPLGQLAKSKIIADIPALQAEEQMRKLGVTPKMTQAALKEAASEPLPKSGIPLKSDIIELAPKYVRPSTIIPKEKTIPETILKEGEMFLEPRLKDEVINEITKASVKSLAGNIDESQRIFQNISRKIAFEEIDSTQIPEILKKFNLSPVEFAKEFANTASYFGRGLSRFGYVAKQLKFIFKDNPEAMTAFDDVVKSIPELSGFENVIDTGIRGLQKIENIRRGVLVTQMATAMRNAWSQAARISIGTIDDVLQGAIKGTIGGEGKTFKQMGDGLNATFAFINRLKPEGRQRLQQILDSDHAILETSRLLSQPVHEVALGSKVTKVLNYLNTTQEIFFRKIAFESKLRSLLSKRGFNFETIDPKHIPVEDYKKAIDYGLEMTFSASPKGTAMNQFLKSWRSSPLSTVNPFPRFGLYNAPKFLYEHSPLGYLHAFSPNSIKQLASGNPDKFAQAASRATIGSLMLMSAWQLRNSKYAGEKHYEIKLGDKYIDARPFAPYSIYLLIAEAFSHPERIKPSDIGMAAIGLNRIAGTGLVLTDWMRSKDVETSKKNIQNFIGQYAGSFAVPARTPKDIVAGIDENEAIIRDTRDNPVIAPFINNLPFISQILPEKVSPLKTGKMKTETPVLRQLTGISLRTKTIIEKESDRLQMDFNQIMPSTGVPAADRIIAKNMAPNVEKFLPVIMNRKEYKDASLPAQKIIFNESLKEIRQMANKQLMLQNPSLGIQIYFEGMSKDMLELLLIILYPGSQDLLKQRGIIK